MASLEDLTPEAVNELAALASDLSNNPATRENFLRLTKKVRPGVPLGEIDIKDDVEAKFQKLEEQLRASEAKLRERDALSELERRRENLKKSGKARNDEDIKAIEKVMLEKGIANHDAAADYFKWMEEASRPTPSPVAARNVLNPETRQTLAPFWKNPRNAALDEAAKALNEIRGNTRP